MAQEWMSWIAEWRHVIFSDEKKFNLDGPDGFQYYWHDLRKEPQYCSKRQAGGGSLMVWGAVGYRGVFELVFIEHTVKAPEYLRMLQQHLVQQAVNVVGPTFVFQQDCASIHTAKVVQEWFRQNDIAVLDWPSKSPDLNIMENLWGLLVRRVYANGKQFDTRAELKTALIAAWASLGEETIAPLYASLPRRVFELIKAQGGPTKY